MLRLNSNWPLGKVFKQITDTWEREATRPPKPVPGTQKRQPRA